MKLQKYQAGFTLTELLLVLTVMGILFSLSTLNLFNAYHGNTLLTTISTFQADLKQQQLKAMVGDTDGQGTNNAYGIYIAVDGNSYTLFKGSSYSAADPDNFVIDINDDLQFTDVLLDQRQIVFASKSGEVANLTNPSLDRLNLTGTGSNEIKTIIINRFGTVTGIQ